MIDYYFTRGTYRAKIKTTYKREDMSMNDYIYSNTYQFESNAEPLSKILTIWDKSAGIKTDILRNAQKQENLYLYNDSFLYGYKQSRQYNSFYSNPNVKMRFRGYVDSSISNLPIIKLTASIYVYSIDNISTLSPTTKIMSFGLKDPISGAIAWLNDISGSYYQDYVNGQTTTFVAYTDASFIFDNLLYQLMIDQVGWRALMEFAVTKITIECGDYEIVTT